MPAHGLPMLSDDVYISQTAEQSFSTFHWIRFLKRKHMTCPCPPKPAHFPPMPAHARPSPPMPAHGLPMLSDDVYISQTAEQSQQEFQTIFDALGSALDPWLPVRLLNMRLWAFEIFRRNAISFETDPRRCAERAFTRALRVEI
jgi:hypothetical protein